jgi:hypothetical protein
MHVEILVEDQSGKVILEKILPRLLGPKGQPHSWRTHAFFGVGSIPKDIRHHHDPRKYMLLNDLPRFLAGFGKAQRDVPQAAVLVVVGSDTKDCKVFKSELVAILRACKPAPKTLIRIAMEEMEAWLMGDREAIRKAYPRAKDRVLEAYVQDSICGTWEALADAIYPGGARYLNEAGYPLIGITKCQWAEAIAPHMDLSRNVSSSFRVFCAGLSTLAKACAAED